MPARLRILVALHVMIGVILGVSGFFSSGGFGVWTAGTLSCFFAAHLLSIPHNSGRYWTVFIAIGLFVIAILQLAAFFQFAGFHLSKDIPITFAIGLPMLWMMTALLMMLLSLHGSVCDYFDDIEPMPQHQSRQTIKEAEQGGDGDGEEAV